MGCVIILNCISGSLVTKGAIGPTAYSNLPRRWFIIQGKSQQAVGLSSAGLHSLNMAGNRTDTVLEPGGCQFGDWGHSMEQNRQGMKRRKAAIEIPLAVTKIAYRSTIFSHLLSLIKNLFPKKR